MNEGAKLSEEKLYECFISLNVPVRLADLKTPTKEFMIQVFHTFLKDIQINITNMIPFEAIRHFENQEYYENGQMLFLLIFTMNEILKEFSPVIITLNDIVAPKPKRTKRIFNYLVIFWIYYLKKADLFCNVEKNLQPEIQKLAELKRHNELLEESYLECVAKLREMLPLKEEIQKSFVQKDEQVKKLEQVRREVLEKYQDLKEEENQLLTQISSVDIAIVNTKEKLSELDQLIVSSPEKKKADIQKLKETIKEVEQLILEKNLEKKEKKKSSDSLELAKEDFAKNYTKQQNMYNELQLFDEQVQLLSSLHTKHQEEKRNLDDLMSTQEMKETMINLYEQKGTKVQLSKKKQIEEISATLTQLQRQKEEEKIQLEKKKLYKIQLEGEIDKKVDSILDDVKKSKNAAAETEKVIEIYESEMQVIDEKYRNNCKKIIEKAKSL